MHQTQWSAERPLPPPVSLTSQSHHEKPPEVTCTSPDEWLNGDWNGMGKLTEADNTVYYGEFERGVKVGRFDVYPAGQKEKAVQKWYYNGRELNV